jgi:hypothetical protein
LSGSTRTHQRVIATLPEGTTGSDRFDCLGQDLTGGQAVIANKSLYLLEDGPKATDMGYSTLLRVRL